MGLDALVEKNSIMIRNYLKIASRNIVKRKLYSFINTVGLSIAIAFCILIYLFIRDEKSFDQFHVNKNDIYRVDNRAFEYAAFKRGEKEPFSETARQRVKLGEVMLEELPDVKAMTRYSDGQEGLLTYKNKVFSERFTAVDSSFFDMFSFRIIAGARREIFRNSSEIVLTPEIAQKYFGDENPIGKVMILNIGGYQNVGGEKPVTVSAVVESAAVNSSLPFDMLVPLQILPWFESENTWKGSSNYPTFVQLSPETDLLSFESKLNQLHEKYVPDNRDFRDREKIPDEYRMNELYLTRLTDIHMDTKVQWWTSSDPKYSVILGGIALLILVVACINYVSLALTGSASRGTEVGIRKVSGAIKRQLLLQFEMESMLLAFASMIIGLALVAISLPAFNEFTGKGIILSLADCWKLAGVSVLIAFSVGLVAGGYPAFYLAALKPALILKGKLTSKTRTWFTRPLVVLQFALSAFLIMSALVMYRQMEYITSKDLGYNQHQVLIIPTQQPLDERTDHFVDNFRSTADAIPTVTSVAGTSVPFTYGTMTMGFQDNDQFKIANGYIVDPAYMRTLGIGLVEGRNFIQGNAADNDAVIVNEALVKDLKWTDPLSEHLSWRPGVSGAGSKIIGVVKDHHFLSLEQPIGPMFLTMDKTVGHYQYMLVKISGIGIPVTIRKLEKVYKSLAPDKPFEYAFLDEAIALQYQSYQRWMNIMAAATGFAILISCLGLFGLAGMNVVSRTKEIGIRKVLGAELSNIFLLLNKQFVWLSVIAFGLASFPAWYAMNKWLNSFQFKIEVTWVMFAVSMAAGLVIALATVSYHTIKAGMVNPADTLKHE